MIPDLHHSPPGSQSPLYRAPWKNKLISIAKWCQMFSCLYSNWYRFSALVTNILFPLPSCCNVNYPYTYCHPIHVNYIFIPIVILFLLPFLIPNAIYFLFPYPYSVWHPVPVTLSLFTLPLYSCYLSLFKLLSCSIDLTYSKPYCHSVPVSYLYSYLSSCFPIFIANSILFLLPYISLFILPFYSSSLSLFKLPSFSIFLLPSCSLFLSLFPLPSCSLFLSLFQLPSCFCFLLIIPIAISFLLL